jgi:BMFP domain-containing protein YqiC
MLDFSLTCPTFGGNHHKFVRARSRTRRHALNKVAAHQRGAPLQTTNADQDGMTMNNFFNDLQGKINQAMDSSPAKDIERNVKAMMTQGFSKLDLVTREEFDIQAQVLAKTRAKLEALELRVAELEARLTETAPKV